MTLNFERIGIPIAMIINKDDKQISKSNNHIVSINENSEETRTSYNDINLNKKEQIFQVIGNPKQERYIYYIKGHRNWNHLKFKPGKYLNLKKKN